MAVTNDYSFGTKSRWTGYLSIGQGAKFDDYNIKNYSLNNNKVSDSQKKWIQELTNLGGRMTADYPSMFMIFMFERDGSEFEVGQSFELKVKLNDNNTVTIENCDEEFWHKAFDKNHEVVVFQVSTAKLSNKIGERAIKEISITIKSSLGRRLTGTHDLSSVKIGMYIKSGFFDYDVEYSKDVNYSSGIYAQTRYGTNGSFYGVKINGSRDDNYHGGVVGYTYARTRYRSEDLKSLAKFRIYYKNGTSLTTTSSVSTKINTASTNISEIRGILSDGTEVLLAGSHELEHWSTAIAENISLKYKTEENYRNKILSVSKTEALFQHQLKAQIESQNEEFIVEDICLDGVSIYDRVNKNSNIYSFTIQEQHTLKNTDASITYPTSNQQFDIGNKNQIDNIEVQIYSPFSTSSEIYSLPDTISLEGVNRYVVFGADYKITKTNNEEEIDVPGHVLIPGEKINTQVQGAMTVFDLTNNGKLNGNFELSSDIYYSISEDRNSERLSGDTSKTLPINYSEIKTDPTSNSLFLHCFPIIKVGDEIVTSFSAPVTFLLSRISSISINSDATKLKGNTLSYFLIDNGSDNNDKYSFNQFVNDRTNLREPQYFGFSRKAKDNSDFYNEKLFIKISQGTQNSEILIPFSTSDQKTKELISILNILKVDLLKNIDFANIGAANIINFLKQHQKEEVNILISLRYYYNENTCKELFSYEFKNLYVEGAQPCLGLRQNGIIVNPRKLSGSNFDENLPNGTAQIINVDGTEMETNGGSGESKLYQATPLVIKTYGGGAVHQTSIEFVGDHYEYDGVNLQGLRNNITALAGIPTRVTNVENTSSQNTTSINTLSNQVNNLSIPHLEVIPLRVQVSEINTNQNISAINAGNQDELFYYDTGIKMVDGYFYVPITSIRFCENDGNATHWPDSFAGFHYTQMDHYKNSNGNLGIKLAFGIHPIQDVGGLSTAPIPQLSYVNIQVCTDVLVIKPSTATSTSLISETPMTTLLEDEDPYASVLSMPRPDEQTVSVEEPENIEASNELEDEEI